MNNLFNKLLNLAIVLVVLLGGYLIFSAAHEHQTTALLQVHSKDAQAVLSITQPGSTAQKIGVGQTKVRVKPGQYIVATSSSAGFATKVISVTQGNSLTVDLDPAQSVILPSVQSINFNGFNNLVDAGVTNGQLSVIESDIFSYKPHTKNVTIDGASLKPEARSYDNPEFAKDFNLTIDGAKYSARISYSGLTDIHLTLANSSGQVYDSGVQLAQ